MSSISLSLTIYILSVLSYYPAEMVVIKLAYSVPPLPLHSSSPFSSFLFSLFLSLSPPLDIPHWSDTQCSLHRHPHPLHLALCFMYFSNDHTVAVMYWLAASMSAVQGPETCTDDETRP